MPLSLSKSTNKSTHKSTHRSPNKSITSSLTLDEISLLRDMANTRIEYLNSLISKCSGSLYPNIYCRQINDIKLLYKKLSSLPFDQEQK